MKLKQQKPDEEIPTSSMADIAFLLIVYFMVTTTFAATRGLDFSLPKEEDDPPMVQKEDSVLIEIRSTGQVVVDQDPMDVDKIIEYLLPKLERNPKKPVIIKPDSDSPYGNMVEVFDTLRQAKLHDGKLITRKQLSELRAREVTDEEWDEGKDINISIPTQREIQSFWF